MGVELHDGLCALYGTGGSFEPVSSERSNRGLDESNLELDCFECDLVRCLFWGIVQSRTCDDNKHHKLQSCGPKLQYDVLLEDRGQE